MKGEHCLFIWKFHCVPSNFGSNCIGLLRYLWFVYQALCPPHELELLRMLKYEGWLPLKLKMDSILSSQLISNWSLKRVTLTLLNRDTYDTGPKAAYCFSINEYTSLPLVLFRFFHLKQQQICFQLQRNSAWTWNENHFGLQWEAAQWKTLLRCKIKILCRANPCSL